MNVQLFLTHHRQIVATGSPGMMSSGVKDRKSSVVSVDKANLLGDDIAVPLRIPVLGFDRRARLEARISSLATDLFVIIRNLKTH